MRLVHLIGYAIFSLTLACNSSLRGQNMYSPETREVLEATIFFPFSNPTQGLTKNQIWNACKETSGKDGFTARFLQASFLSTENRAIHYFEDARKYGIEINLGYDTLGLIDYYIADLNIYKGNLRSAELLLSRIINRASTVDYIYWLAKIKRARLFPNKSEIANLEKSISQNFQNSLSPIQVAYLILQFTSNLEGNSKLAFYKRMREKIIEADDPLTTFYFANGSVNSMRAGSNNKNEVTQAIDLLKYSFNRIKKKTPEIKATYFYTLSKEYSLNGNYVKSSEMAALACAELGIDTTLAFDINAANTPPHKAVDFLSNLALTKLYLGRAGEREAFEIYYRLADQYLINHAANQTGWDIAGAQWLEKKILVPKILYVGDYLYKETGERSYLNRALAMVDANRGSTLYSQLFRREAIRNGGGLSELLKKDLALSRREYQLSQEENDDGRLLDRMIATQKERQDLMANLAKSYPDYLEQRSAVSPDFIGEQQQRLAQSGGSLLYYLHHGNFSFRVLINADSIQVDNLYHRVLDKNALPQLMAAYPACVNQSPGIDGQLSDDCRSEGYTLYQMLVGGIADQLNEKVLIIGDGPFANFPFSSLPVNAEGSDYFGTRYRLSYNISARLQQLMEEREITPTYHKVLAFSPSGMNQTFASERGQESLSSLQNTGSELDAIEAMLPGTFYRETEATRENLLNEISLYEVIHLASHASADDNDGRLSYLVLNQDASGVSAPLYAVELAEQELDAELVVLSACETGSGSDHLSEGTLGLTHAFTAAGARSVISSRWSVDDRATSELMGHFYTHIKAGKPKDKALQRAQQDYRAHHAGTYLDHPYYWSAFVLMGGADAVTFQPTAGGFNLVWLVGGGAVLLAGGYLLARRKLAA